MRQISCALTTYRRWIWEDDAVPPDVMQVIREHTHLPDAFHGDWQAWHRDPAQMGPGGVFLDLGVYPLDTILWLADSPPVAVTGLTECEGWHYRRSEPSKNRASRRFSTT